MSIKFKKLNNDAILPKKASLNAIGLDVSTTGEYDYCKSNNVVYWKTGLSVEPPTGYYFQLHARSSLHKMGWMLANSVGIIDPDYRGEIIIALQPISHSITNEDGNLEFDINLIDKGTRIAQLILCKNELIPFEITEVTNLSKTDRGNGGFGSTGLK